MLNSNLNFDADTLACALALTGKPTPTAAALATALGELYPAGNGPAVPDLLAAGWLVPTVDGRGLRVPPLPLTEQNAWLAEVLPGMVVKLTTIPPVPELVLKLNATQPVSLAEQDARLVTHESKNALVPEEVTEPGTPSLPADHEIKSELVPVRQGCPTEWTALPASPRFSYYRGGIAATLPYAAITPAQLYTVLTCGRHRAQTEALRAAPVGSPERADLKKRLDYVTPAGTFTRRANNALDTASGLLVLDFDHVPDVGAARAALLADTQLAGELVLLFTSPSGDGLKALVTADPAAAHLDTFRAYAAYLGAHYAALGLVPDEAGKDVARACFVPYAPDAWLAPAYAA